MSRSSKNSAWNEVVAIILLGAGTLLFLALISYNPKDLPSWVPWSYLSPPNKPAQNFIGPFGAIIAGFCYLTLGAASYFIAGVLFPIAFFTRVPIRTFFNAVKQPALIALSTASSEAALPLALERMEEMGVPRRIVAFVLPIGYSFNLDGSTLYLAVASIFRDRESLEAELAMERAAA